MECLNEKDTALINRMVSDNCDITVIKATAALLLHLDKTKTNYVAKPIVIVAGDELISELVYGTVNEHLGTKCTTDEIMAHGKDTIKVLTNHCDELRHHGSCFFYYKDSVSVLRNFPDEFFFVIEVARDSSVKFGLSGDSSIKHSVNLSDILAKH